MNNLKRDEYLKKIRAVENISKNTLADYNSGGSGTDDTSSPPLDFTEDSSIPDVKTYPEKIKLPTGDRGAFNDKWKKYIVDAGGPNKAPLYTQLNSTKFDVCIHKNNKCDGWVRKDFAHYLEVLHSRVAKKIGVKKLYIMSGYRTPKYNSGMSGSSNPGGGGAAKSPHMAGIAVDITVSGKNRYIVADEAWEMGFGGIAYGTNFVHLDIGPKGYWGYPETGYRIYKNPTSRG